MRSGLARGHPAHVAERVPERAPIVDVERRIAMGPWQGRDPEQVRAGAVIERDPAKGQRIETLGARLVGPWCVWKTHILDI